MRLKHDGSYGLRNRLGHSLRSQLRSGIDNRLYIDLHTGVAGITDQFTTDMYYLIAEEMLRDE